VRGFNSSYCIPEMDIEGYMRFFLKHYPAGLQGFQSLYYYHKDTISTLRRIRCTYIGHARLLLRAACGIVAALGSWITQAQNHVPAVVPSCRCRAPCSHQRTTVCGKVLDLVRSWRRCMGITEQGVEHSAEHGAVHYAFTSTLSSFIAKYWNNA
jgi:hypothetical protein